MKNTKDFVKEETRKQELIDTELDSKEKEAKAKAWSTI
jgi:hypothetical protein